MSVFTWVPDFGATMERQPNVRSVKFGDGYEQRAQFGINADMRKYNLTFGKRASSESAAILSFLETAGGVTSFTYTHVTDGTARQYICRSWKASDSGYGVTDITATFEQVPA